MQTMWQINWTSFNLVLDWSQLCIPPTRESYICQYGKVSGPEKAFSVLVFHETKSAVTVQRQFWQKYRKSPPSQLSICAWYKCFVTNGYKIKSTGRPSVSAKHVETIWHSFVRSPHKSVRCANKELKPVDRVKWYDFFCNFWENWLMMT
jgi:hypothetical protein